MAQKTRGAKSARVITIMAKRPKKDKSGSYPDYGLTDADRDKKYGVKHVPERGDFYGEDESGNLTKQ